MELYVVDSGPDWEVLPRPLNDRKLSSILIGTDHHTLSSYVVVFGQVSRLGTYPLNDVTTILDPGVSSLFLGLPPRTAVRQHDSACDAVE